jgi:hypothetical protein
MPKNISEFSMDDNHRTMNINTTGVAKSTQLICVSTLSTASSKEKYHDMPKKNEITARIRITGYGRGYREKASKIEELVLLP